MLPRKNRLKDKYFKELYQRGKKFRGEYGMLITKKTPEIEEPQFAFVVSKKIGNAVQRHRTTRLLRELARGKISEVKNVSFLYVAYIYCDEYEKLEEDFNKQFTDAIRDN